MIYSREESQNHRIFWKGPLRSPHFNSPAIGKDTLHKTTKTPSSLVLHTFRDGTSTTSLFNLFQCFITLIVKNFFLNEKQGDATAPSSYNTARCHMTFSTQVQGHLLGVLWYCSLCEYQEKPSCPVLCEFAFL